MLNDIVAHAAQEFLEATQSAAAHDDKVTILGILHVPIKS